MFEWLFTGAMNEVVDPKVIRPGEQCLDGIIMTPDGYNIDDAFLEEYKFTTKSSRWGILDKRFSRWINYQIPAYCKALRLLQCRLKVLYMRGDYTDGIPIFMEYVLVYQQHELDETWDQILLNAQYMIDNKLVDYEAT